MIRLRTVAMIFVLACAGVAQAADGNDYKGFSSYTSFTETRDSSLGWATEINNSVRYDFNRFFAVQAGLPVYVVRTFAATTTTGTTTTTQPATTYASAGDLFLRMGLFARAPVVRYSGILTTTAPTGDRTHNTTSGRATIDLNNRLEGDLWLITPFAEAGLGNTVLSTREFSRPFTTLGKNAHFRAGIGIPLFKGVSFEPSAYDVLPIGDQKIYSRLISRTTSMVQTTGRMSRGKPSFDMTSVISGASSLVSDHGFSGALNISPSRRVDMQVAYTRSVGYSLDSVSVSLGFRLGHLPPQEMGKK